MKRYLLFYLLYCSALSYCSAQNVNLQKWVNRNVDSLQREHIDTIIYYHSYCGECYIIQSKSDLHKDCTITDDSWTQLENRIIYQQNGQYFTLTFNCNYPPLKQQLKTGYSIPYFISIIPVLNKRDQVQNKMFKQHKFNPPVLIDGGYEEASIYLHKTTKRIYLQEYQKTDKNWRKFFWIDKETYLFKLIADDLKGAKN